MAEARTHLPEPGPLDRAPARWRVALRRLPVTLAVLLIAGGGAAGLAYVASGSGAHRFPATLLNDLGETVEVGACAADDCKSGGSLNAFRLAPGQEMTVAPGAAIVSAWAAKSVVQVLRCVSGEAGW